MLMGYLSIRAMRSHKVSRGNGNDEGGEEFPQEPKIDLPPGVVWPSDSPEAERETIEV